MCLFNMHLQDYNIHTYITYTYKIYMYIAPVYCMRISHVWVVFLALAQHGQVGDCLAATTMCHTEESVKTAHFLSVQRTTWIDLTYCIPLCTGKLSSIWLSCSSRARKSR